MMDGEDLIEKVCEKNNIDTEKISEKDWDNAVSQADDFIEMAIEHAVENEMKILAYEFGLNNYVDSAKKEEVKSNESDKT